MDSIERDEATETGALRARIAELEQQCGLPPSNTSGESVERLRRYVEHLEQQCGCQTGGVVR